MDRFNPKGVAEDLPHKILYPKTGFWEWGGGLCCATRDFCASALMVPGTLTKLVMYALPSASI
jgi:hypothetical protein